MPSSFVSRINIERQYNGAVALKRAATAQDRHSERTREESISNLRLAQLDGSFASTLRMTGSEQDRGSLETIMIRLTRAQIREIERRTIEEYKIPGVVLMENAARAVADVACEMLEDQCVGRVMVLCGGGNNGGD